MPKSPYKDIDTLINKKYSQYGGKHRFRQIVEEDIPVEKRILKISDEFPISYRTALRWYYRAQEETKSAV